MIRRITLARVVTLCIAAGAPTPAARADATIGAERCYNAWSDAAVIVQRQSLTPVRDLHAEARRRNLGDIVKVTLCTERSSFVYRLLVREPAGRVVTMIVDAATPFTPK